MKRTHKLAVGFAVVGWSLCPTVSFASSILYNNDFATTSMASASTPSGNGFIERESADDFLLSSSARITSATFTGLIPAGATIQQVVIEFYRVFPTDSNTLRAPNVNTRVNSPSDVEFVDRDSVVPGELKFTTNVLTPTFTALNSVVNDINPKPNQMTLGEGPQTGQEVQFTVTFTLPVDLPADHYFFVPQVLLGNSTTPFLWLSAPRPPSVTPFAPDLQSWIRDERLDPDWSRIGTDIVGGAPAPTFNAAFSLTGDAIPEPGTMTLVLLGGAGIAGRAWKQRRRRV